MWAVLVPFLLLDFVPKLQNPAESVTFDSWVNFAENIE